MENNDDTPPATRNYCVWADRTRRLCQGVTATSPEDARRVAADNPGEWVYCIDDGSEPYRLSCEVLDIDTGETFEVGGATHCKTCGSEVVETVNDSNFGDGECGGCEYRRYKSQPALLAACEEMSGMIYRDKNGGERIDLDRYEQAERTCRSAISQAEHGNAA